MKILIGSRKRLTEGKGVYVIFCLTLMIHDKHAVTIGGDKRTYRDALKLAQEISEYSKGVISYENEPPDRQFKCSGCGEMIEESDLWRDAEIDEEAQNQFIGHYIYEEGYEPRECGPVEGYTGMLTDTEEQETPSLLTPGMARVLPETAALTSNETEVLENDPEESIIDIEKGE